ncbi:hypothetical protein CIP107577_01965 [Corynebacterium diphtheriae]|nr:hypothetical protein CIP107577_01965 [Corynebacterium diphtheriae]
MPWKRYERKLSSKQWEQLKKDARTLFPACCAACGATGVRLELEPKDEDAAEQPPALDNLILVCLQCWRRKQAQGNG